MTGGDPRDAGSAVVEFLLLAVILVVPFVYAVIALFGVERAAFAVTAAAREGGRAYITAQSGDAAVRRAEATADLVLADHGLGRAPVRVACGADPCLTPGARVWFDLTVAVPVPLVPHLRGRAPASIRVHVRHVEVVDRFREQRS